MVELFERTEVRPTGKTVIFRGIFTSFTCRQCRIPLRIAAAATIGILRAAVSRPAPFLHCAMSIDLCAHRMRTRFVGAGERQRSRLVEK